MYNEGRKRFPGDLRLRTSRSGGVPLSAPRSPSSGSAASLPRAIKLIADRNHLVVEVAGATGLASVQAGKAGGGVRDYSSSSGKCRMSGYVFRPCLVNRCDGT